MNSLALISHTQDLIKSTQINLINIDCNLKQVKTLFYGVILGYKNTSFELPSVENDRSLWKNLCKQKNFDYYFTTDINYKITPDLIESKMKKTLLKALDGMYDLIIILLSGHGKADANGAYLYLLYDNESDMCKISNLKWFDYSTRLKKFLISNEQIISSKKLNLLFLIDTCYSGNVLHLNYELVFTQLPLTRQNFEFYEYIPENSNVIKKQKIWIVGAAKKLTHVTYKINEYTSEFTTNICRLNTLNHTTLSQSLVKIQKMFPECSIFFSQI